MGCNCGDNEYNITVDNNGNCEPTTPIYNITLANVGVNGYSPIVRFINETVESFNIAVDNITGTETSPAVPKLSYVADQINGVNNTIANLGNTYLTKDGSNANNPITINSLRIRDNSGYVTIGQADLPALNLQSRNINLVGTDSEGNQQSIIQLQNDGDVLVYAGERLLLRGSGARPLYQQGTGTTYSLARLTDIPTKTSDLINDSGYITNSDLPTVGNGTITIVQGGVTKGTFTTNQSGNSTIQLDGAIIDNPFVVNASTGYEGNAVLYASGAYGGTDAGTRLETIWIDTVESTEHKYTHGLYINNGGRYKEYPVIQYKKEDYIPSTGSSTINSTDLGFINAGIYSTIPTLTAPIYVTRSGAGYIVRLEYDNDTLKVNQNGKLYADVQGGSSYTAGTGIDITNDTISVDSSVVLTSGNQTISGLKTFEYIKFTNSLMIPIDNIDRSVLSVDDGTLYVGTRFTNLYLAGLGTRPQYNNSEYLALYSDIPTVNDSTITFTQGGVTKGTITLNQSSNQTIELDAGGSGGGAVDSVNGQTGTVVLTASDVGALPSSITIPTKTSDLTNDSGYITSSALAPYTLSSSLATVATSGSYTDLSNKPTIPTVNNATITFTQGGTTKGTIALNQSSNQTIALDNGATIDDTTPSSSTVYSSQKTQDLINALVARIMALEANINGGNA